MDFRIYGDKSLLQDAQNVITDLEKKVSVTDSDSEIYKINENGSGILSGEADTLMKNALEMCRRTNGVLDISIYPIVKAWGFTTGSYQVPDEETIQTLLTKVDYTQIQYDETSGNVTIPEGMTIDLGSIAKGYAGELAARALHDKGVTSALLNLGGNVQTIGTKPDGSLWKVAIQNPTAEEDADFLGILETNDCAVITSGGYERYFEENGVRYHHIMDPATGKPAKSDLTSVTIISENGTLADGLSTALFVMGLDKAIAYWQAHASEFDAVLCTEDETLYVTDGIQDAFSANYPCEIIQQKGAES